MKISTEFDTIVGFAREEAMRTGSYSIEADHLLLGILRHRDNEAVEMLRDQGLDPDEMKRRVDSLVFHEHCIPFDDEDSIRLGRDGSSAVNLAIAEAMSEGSEQAGALHLLKAIYKQGGSVSSDYLHSKGFMPSGQKAPKKERAEATAAPSPELLGKLLSTIRINTKIVS